MNRTTCGLIRSCLTRETKYHVLHETSASYLWEILEKKYLTKSIESGSTTAEALALRGRSYNRKGRGDQERLKSRSGSRDLKKNQCVLCKELGHWKVDCLKAKGKKKELKTKANLVQVVSTH